MRIEDYKHKSFITHEQINKKLCIHCKHCEVFPGLGMKDKIMCCLYRDKVNNSAIYNAWESRYVPWLCGGRKWEMSSDIEVCPSEEVAEYLRREDWVESFMPFAKQVVEGKAKVFCTCDGLQEAIKRQQNL